MPLPRHALITGASRRLGRAIALALAGQGFDLSLHYGRSHAEAASLAEEIRALGRRAHLLQADLQQEAETQELVPRAVAAQGPLGLLVNNAAVFERDEWHDASRESWDLHIETNLRAPFALIQGFAKALPQEAEGLVVNLLDQRVWSLTPHFVSYSVSKAGLWALTQSMALALAPRIRVNGIGPGFVLPSPFQTPAQFARQYASPPLGHGTTPEEVAEAVLALLRLPAMTGQMIALDGGQHLQWSPRP